MRKALVLSVVLLAAAVAAGLALSGAGPARTDATPAAVASSSRPSPADRQIRAAQQKIDDSPNDPVGYTTLAAAYLQKARETGDFGFNVRAERAVDKAFEVAPDDYEALKLRATVLATYHRFVEARDVARRAEQRHPEDYDVYGVLVDALVELGEYDAAVEAAQTMVDLKPCTASYSRVSYLRSLHGDPEGAVDAMRLAAKAASPADPESVAWCNVHLGDELFSLGRRDEAERSYDFALHTFPDYHLALAAKARARRVAGDTEAAIALYTRALERVPLPDTAIALGDLYTALGRTAEAGRQYQLVEAIERLGSAESGTYSLKIAEFWADHDTRLDEALAVARRERAVRADIYTCDVLAWCLYKKGLFEEADVAIAEALRLGTRDARIHYHAGLIAEALGDRARATTHLETALALEPTLGVLAAGSARIALERLHG